MGQLLQRSYTNKHLQEREVHEDVPRASEPVDLFPKIGHPRRLVEEAKWVAEAVLGDEVGREAAIGIRGRKGVLARLSEHLVAELLGEGVDVGLHVRDLGLGEELI